MTNQRAPCQGILAVCRCGNRFLVPPGKAGARVPCTLCGAPLVVAGPCPAQRGSVQQAAADTLAALEAREQQVRERQARRRPPANGEGEPAPAAGHRWSRPAADPERPPAVRRHRRLVMAGLVVLGLVLAGGAAVVCLVGGTPSGWSRNAYTSEAGGFAVRLPTGLTARRFVERRTARPPYTFEGVAFGDGTCVGVGYIDFRDDEPLAELPEAVMRFLEREYHGDVAVAETCAIRVGRHPGRQVTYQPAAGSPRRSYSRWFLVGNRLYDVAWITGYRQPSIDAVATFLDSFRLLAEPAAEVTSVREAAAPLPAADGSVKP